MAVVRLYLDEDMHTFIAEALQLRDLLPLTHD